MKKQGAVKVAQVEGDAAVVCRHWKTGAATVPPVRAVMLKALAAFGRKMPSGSTDAEVFAAIQDVEEKLLQDIRERDDVYRAKCAREGVAVVEAETPMQKEAADCEACGMLATYQTDYCPYCGDAGEGEPEAVPVIAPAPAQQVEQPGLPERQVEQPAPELLPARVEPVAPAPAEVQGVVEVLPATVAPGRLAAAVARVELLLDNVQLNFYDLGLELRRINEEDLWKEAGCGSFKAFCRESVRLSESMVWSLIRVAKEYDRETFERVGRKKLDLISTIGAGSARDSLLEAAKEGATVRELKEKVAEAGGGKKSAPPPEEAPGAPARESTVALLGRVDGAAKRVGFRTAEESSVADASVKGSYAAIPVVEGVELHVALKRRGDGEVVGLSYRFVSAE